MNIIDKHPSKTSIRFKDGEYIEGMTVYHIEADYNDFTVYLNGRKLSKFTDYIECKDITVEFELNYADKDNIRFGN